MAIVNDIISRSLRLLKVKASGENPKPAEYADGLEILNSLLDSWSNEEYLQFGRTQISHTLVASDSTYTIGSGSDIDTSWPVRIESAFIRDSEGVDTPLELINNKQFAEIDIKTQSSSYPSMLYYNRQYPNGVINLFPVPANTYTLYLNVWPQIPQYTEGTDVVNLPPGYKRALEYNLAVEISPEYKIPDTIGVIMSEAQKSIARIKIVNDNAVPIIRNDLFGRNRTNRTVGANF